MATSQLETNSESLGDINRDVLGREHVNLTSDHKQIAFIRNENTQTPSLNQFG